MVLAFITAIREGLDRIPRIFPFRELRRKPVPAHPYYPVTVQQEGPLLHEKKTKEVFTTADYVDNVIIAELFWSSCRCLALSYGFTL